MKLQHIIESQQFTLPMLNDLFELADQMERIVARGGTLDYQKKIMASLSTNHQRAHGFLSSRQ